MIKEGGKETRKGGKEERKKEKIKRAGIHDHPFIHS